MAVTVAPTPNPNALKFTVGSDVGGPGTYAKGSEPDDPYLADLLALDGVVSVFFTADFVTITKSPGASWDEIRPAASAILDGRFGD